jgi:two-component system invasion response regulator UvrY
MKDKQIKIAIADDHTLFRKGIIELINSFGEFQVIIDAVNGKELIDALKESAQLPDICIIDINMPVLNGYDTAYKIRHEWPEVKIMALSMLNEEFSVIKMLRSGANGYIIKDSEAIDLHRALIGIYEHPYYHSELVTTKMLYDLHQNDKKNSITEKEIEFLHHCCTELTYKQIANIMNVSPRTIDDYRDALFAKLKLKSRTALAIFALRTGLSNTE